MLVLFVWTFMSFLTFNSPYNAPISCRQYRLLKERVEVTQEVLEIYFIKKLLLANLGTLCASKIKHHIII